MSLSGRQSEPVRIRNQAWVLFGTDRPSINLLPRSNLKGHETLHHLEYVFLTSFPNNRYVANIGKKAGMKRVRPTGILLWKATARANRDYTVARGTAHLKQIDHALRNLRSRIEHLREQLSELQTQISHLRFEIKDNLKRALLSKLVSERLKEVPGIGPALAQEILDRCYDGTLESLSRAYLYVRGIGEKRQLAINEWVQLVKSQLPTLLNQDFPKKAEIIEYYQARITRLERTKKSLEEKLSELYAFQRQVTEKVQWLRTVSPAHFARTYQGDEEARDLVLRYLLGVFPPWGEAPEWFKRLLEEFG